MFKIWKLNLCKLFGNYKVWKLEILFFALFLFLLAAKNVDAAVINRAPLYLSSNNGLVGYWTMDGKNVNWKTGAVTDSSGKGNNGTVTNMSTSTSQAIGRIGQALNFDGVDDDVAIPHSSSLDMSGGSITITAWLYQNAITNQMAILDNGNNTTAGFRFITADGDGRRLKFIRGALFADGVLSNSGVLVASAWQHVAVSFNGTTATFYVNGIAQGGGNPANSSIANTGEKKIGEKTYSGSGVVNFNGLIDEVRVYNRALSANEVATLFNSGAAKFNVSPTKYLTDGLVGYWTMDGKNVNWKTGAVTDSSGKGNTGFVTNMATSTSQAIGRIGQALEFDGVDDYVEVPSNVSFNIANGTISLWIKTDGSWNTDGGSTSDSAILFSRHDASSAFNGIGLKALKTGASAKMISAEVKNGTATVLNISGTITAVDNAWHHIVFIFRQANGATSKIYVDGIEDVSGTNSAAWTFNSQVIRLGDSTDSVNFFEEYKGLIDEVRVYSRALSANEVATLFNSGAAKFNVSPTKYLTDGLVGYWTMDGKNVNWKTGAVTDSSGKGNTGFVVGTSTPMSTSTAPAIGKIGQALNFDGVDDYVGLPTNTLSYPFSVSLWIKPTVLKRQGVLVGYRKDSDCCGIAFYDSTRIFIQGVRGGTQARGWDTNLSTLIPSRTWTNVAATYISASNNTLYINGVSYTKELGDGFAAFFNCYDSIGRANFSSAPIPGDCTTDSFFDGLIDDVRIYNRVLSANEVLQLYNAGR